MCFPIHCMSAMPDWSAPRTITYGALHWSFKQPFDKRFQQRVYTSRVVRQQRDQERLVTLARLREASHRHIQDAQGKQLGDGVAAIPSVSN